MTETSNEFTADQLERLLAEHGSKAAVARHLDRPESTVKDWYQQTVQNGTVKRSKTPRIPQVTKDMLDAALLPPNNCQVGVLLDAIREAGQEDTLETVKMMLALPHRELSADQFRSTLRSWDFPESLIPEKNHIGPHRNQTLPCRCASHAAVNGR